MEKIDKPPFASQKPVLDQKRGMGTDGMGEVKRVSDQPADPHAAKNAAGQFMGGHKDLGSQIPVKK